MSDSIFSWARFVATALDFETCTERAIAPKAEISPRTPMERIAMATMSSMNVMPHSEALTFIREVWSAPSGSAIAAESGPVSRVR